MYSRTPVERPLLSTTIRLIQPDFVLQTVFSVCVVLDRRPSPKCDQRPGQMQFSLSQTTTSEYSLFPGIAGGGSLSVPNGGLLQYCTHS